MINNFPNSLSFILLNGIKCHQSLVCNLIEGPIFYTNRFARVAKWLKLEAIYKTWRMQQWLYMKTWSKNPLSSKLKKKEYILNIYLYDNNINALRSSFFGLFGALISAKVQLTTIVWNMVCQTRIYSKLWGYSILWGTKKIIFFPIPEIPKYSRDIFLYYEYVLYIYQN